MSARDDHDREMANAAAVVPRLPDGRVLVGERTHAARSWPGTVAFPGGGLEESDRALPLLEGEGLPPAARAVRACALRELGEEVALWRLSKADGRHDVAAHARASAALAQGAPLAEVLAREQLVLDDRGLVPLTLWRVPSGRFAVQQFLLSLDGEPALAPVATDELDHVRWVSPRALLADWRAGRAFLLSPIRRVVAGLAAHEHDPVAAMRALAQPPTETERARLDLVEGVCLLAARSATLPPATHTNAVLLGGLAGAAILVDPAAHWADERARFDRLLESALGGRTLTAIICTHHHVDHVADVSRLAHKHGAPVWAHKETAARLGCRVDRLLDDGDRVETALATFQVLHTPGHAPGHLCLFDEATRVMVAGDMIAAEGSILIDPDDGHMGLYLASLDRMIALEPRGVVPAHGPLIANGVARLSEQRGHRHERQGRVEAAARGTGVRDIAVEVYGADTPAAMLPFAERSVLAALRWAEERGVASEHDGRWTVR
ncbi:MAG: MBL fold metallo-hydrolase [Deltaproteobacteria bacterium]|nr:MBL fold metallo-hydrolase [Deltaproteobacteria bacterium]